MVAKYGKTWTNLSREYKTIFKNRGPGALKMKYTDVFKNGFLNNYMKLADKLNIEQTLNNFSCTIKKWLKLRAMIVFILIFNINLKENDHTLDNPLALLFKIRCCKFP